MVSNLAKGAGNVVVRCSPGSINQVSIILMINPSGFKEERPITSGYRKTTEAEKEGVMIGV
jgi:hypothetical protein